MSTEDKNQQQSNENQQQPRVFKQFSPISCPHCGKNFYIGSQSMMYNVVSTPTLKEIQDAKERVKKRLEEIDFANEEEKQSVFDYINNEETILDYSDIEHFIKQISMDQVEKQQKENNQEK